MSILCTPFPFFPPANTFISTPIKTFAKVDGAAPNRSDTAGNLATLHRVACTLASRSSRCLSHLSPAAGCYDGTASQHVHPLTCFPFSTSFSLVRFLSASFSLLPSAFSHSAGRIGDVSALGIRTQWGWGNRQWTRTGGRQSYAPAFFASAARPCRISTHFPTRL